MGYDVNNAYRSGATGAEILRCAQDDSEDPAHVLSRKVLFPNV